MYFINGNGDENQIKLTNGDGYCIICKCYAGVAELADALDLGSSAHACRFKSCHPHQIGCR